MLTSVVWEDKCCNMICMEFLLVNVSLFYVLSANYTYIFWRLLQLYFKQNHEENRTSIRICIALAYFVAVHLHLNY